MKCPPVLLVSVLSTAAGFAAVSAGRKALERFQSNAAAGGGSAGEREASGGAAAAESGSAGKNSARPATGPALAVQFRALLSQLGLDPAWAEGLAAGDPSGFPDLLEKMKTLPDVQKGPLRDFLLGRWAALDPAGGVAFFQSAKDEDGLADLFRQWQRLDFPAAAAKAGEYGDKILRRTLRDRALLDPAGLLAWLAGRPDLNPLSVFSTGGDENTKALIRLTEADPDKMLSWLRQLPEDKWNRDLVKNLAAQLAKNSPDEAIAWAKSIKDSKQSATALAGVAGALAAASPERALSLLAALPEAEDYEGRGSLIEAMAKIKVRDGAQAAELVKAMPPGEARAVLRHVVLGQLLESDPAAALARLQAGASVGNGMLWSGAIVTRLLNEDMAAGVRLGGLTGSTMDLNQMHYPPSGVKWVERDPAKAAGLLSALPPGDFRDRGLNATISALAKTDLAAAIALQERFPRLEVEAFDQIERNDFYKAWAGKDLPSLTAFLNDKAAEKDQPALKAAIALDLGERDPRSALDWTAANLSGGLRTETVEKILSSLTKNHPDAALAWLDSLSPGTALNSAVETFAKSLPDSDPAALLAKAETLPEGDARKAITTKAYGQMYEKNPEDMLKNLASQPQTSLPDGLWRQLGATTGDIDSGLSRLAALPPEAAPDFVRGLFQRNIGWDDFSKFSRAMGSLSDPENRAAAIESAMPRLQNQYARVTEWAQSLPPTERSQVADLMEKNIYNLTDTQRRELITPLR